MAGVAADLLCHDLRPMSPIRRYAVPALLLLAVLGPPAVSATSRSGSGSARTILWKADAESAMTAEWASNSSVPAAASPPRPAQSRIRRSAFRAQGKRSYRFSLRNGDDSYGERAELGQAMPSAARYKRRLFGAGQERWIAMQYYLPTSWPTDDTWQTVLQIKPATPGGGGPSIGLDAGADRLRFYGNDNRWGSTAGAARFGAGPLTAGSYPLTKGRWIKLTWHVVFSADPRVGSLEVFGDLADGRGMRTLAPRRRRATMKYLDGGMDPAQLRVGIYRDPKMTAPAKLYVDGLTVAMTRAGAEANAYGRRAR
jgi:Polysaccharide lyase